MTHSSPRRVSGPGNGGPRPAYAPRGIFPGPVVAPGTAMAPRTLLTSAGFGFYFYKTVWFTITGICIIHLSPNIELENKTSRPTRVVLSFDVRQHLPRFHHCLSSHLLYQTHQAH
jgi:hypothetical protein